jgi:hypothetical protein
MFRSFSAGSLRLNYRADWEAEDFTAGYNSDHADVDSFQPVLHFPLDPIALTWLKNNSTAPAAAPFAPTPAQVSPVPAKDVSIEAPFTVASSNNTSSSGRYETTGSITVRNFHKRLAELYGGSTRLILAVDEQGSVIVLLPAPQVSHHIADHMYSRRCLAAI